jgi:hypothetical protein
MQRSSKLNGSPTSSAPKASTPTNCNAQTPSQNHQTL